MGAYIYWGTEQVNRAAVNYRQSSEPFKISFVSLNVLVARNLLLSNSIFYYDSGSCIAGIQRMLTCFIRTVRFGYNDAGGWLVMKKRKGRYGCDDENGGDNAQI